MTFFVIDDHPLMREAVVLMLRRLKPQASIVGMDRLSAAIDAELTHGAPRLVTLDLRLPDSDGVGGVRWVKARWPQATLIVITASPAADVEQEVMAAGADGFLEKSAPASEISNMLRGVLEVNSDSESTPSSNEKLTLSRRQHELLLMMERGLSNRQIADELQISEHTVKVHLWRLFRRINVNSRTQAIHLARSAGLI
jgi:DNA-binding NarL/FixJ family response regulator